MQRLLPFRQYNEHSVVNLFSLDLSSFSTAVSLAGFTNSASGVHDSGVLVKVKSTAWAAAEPAGYGPATGTPNAALQDYLGKTNHPYVAHNEYPEVGAKFEAVDGTEKNILGVTLRETLAFDENGEKLLYYRQKLEDLYGVLPGEVVPVLTKGIITVSEKAIDDKSATNTDGLVRAAANGKFDLDTSGSGTIVGKLLGVGDRKDVFGGSGGNPDYFAGDGSTGKYYIINLDL